MPLPSLTGHEVSGRGTMNAASRAAGCATTWANNRLAAAARAPWLALPRSRACRPRVSPVPATSQRGAGQDPSVEGVPAGPRRQGRGFRPARSRFRCERPPPPGTHWAHAGGRRGGGCTRGGRAPTPRPPARPLGARASGPPSGLAGWAGQARGSAGRGAAQGELLPEPGPGRCGDPGLSALPALPPSLQPDAGTSAVSVLRPQSLRRGRAHSKRQPPNLTSQAAALGPRSARRRRGTRAASACQRARSIFRLGSVFRGPPSGRREVAGAAPTRRVPTTPKRSAPRSGPRGRGRGPQLGLRIGPRREGGRFGLGGIRGISERTVRVRGAKAKTHRCVFPVSSNQRSFFFRTPHRHRRHREAQHRLFRAAVQRVLNTQTAQGWAGKLDKPAGGRGTLRNRTVQTV